MDVTASPSSIEKTNNISPTPNSCRRFLYFDQIVEMCGGQGGGRALNAVSFISCEHTPDVLTRIINLSFLGITSMSPKYSQSQSPFFSAKTQKINLIFYNFGRLLQGAAKN